MRHFRRNVFRLAGQNKGSFVGAVLIIAIGIFIYVAMMDTLRNLRDQVEEYYRTSSMADVFAQVSAISHAELERMKEHFFASFKVLAEPGYLKVADVNLAR